MTLRLPLIIILSLFLLSCDERPTKPTPQESQGELRLHFVDSFHLSDFPSDTIGVVNYRVEHGPGFFEEGSFSFPIGSLNGDYYTVPLPNIPAGQYAIRVSVNRPFIVLRRKDSTSQARFADSFQVPVPANYFVDAPEVDIWAYRLNRLVVYFNHDITRADADSIVESLGGEVISRSLAFIDSSYIYRVSTLGLGHENLVKPVFESQAGVRFVLFDIYGHNYF